MKIKKLERICLWKEVFCHNNGHDTHIEHDLILEGEPCYQCDGRNIDCGDYLEILHYGEEK